MMGFGSLVSCCPAVHTDKLRLGGNVLCWQKWAG